MKKSVLLEQIDQCLALCDSERIAGYSGEATKDQIEDCVIPDLVSLRQNIINNDLPKDRWLASFANAFKAWNWSHQNPTKLFSALAELNNTYKKSGDFED